MPLLLEPDAEFLTLNYDALSPENQAKAKEWLGNYKQQQYDKGEPLFPTQEKASIEKKLKLRGMFEAPEKIDYDPGPMSANPAMDRMQYANMALLSQRYQKEPREVSERYDLLMNDYTRQNFGVGETVDTAKFYALAQKEFQRMKQVEDTSLEGAKAALRGEDVIKSLQAWQAKNLDRIPDSTEFTKGYLNASEAVGDFVPMAKELLGELEAGFFKTKEGKRPRQENPDKLRDLTLELAQMKGRDRKQVYAALGAQIEAAGYDQKGFWAQTLGFLGKNVASMGQRLNRQALGVAITAATTPPASINDEFGFGPSSEEEFPQLAEEGRLAVELNDKLAEVEKDIARIVSGDLDPVKATTGWMNETFEKGLIKAPGATLPSMTIIGTLGPFAGGAVIAADFAESNRTELIAQGFDPQDAKRIGAIAAPMQAAVESLSNMFQLGRFPAVTAALSRFTRPVGGASLIGRYAQNTLIAGGTETAEELIQDQFIVPIVTAIDQDTQIGFGKIWENIKTQTPELLSVTLPMALVFGGKMTAADAKLSGVMTQDIDGLKSLGYSEAQAITVVSEKTELDRIKKASSLWDSRAGDKVTIETGAKNLAERMRQLSGDVMAQQQELERRGKLPILRPMVDGKWLMTIPSDGSAATFNTHQEADAARWTWAEDQLGKVHALTRETLASMEKNLNLGREVAVEFFPDVRTAQDAVNEGASVEQIKNRVEQGKALGDISPDTSFEDAQAIDKATTEADGFLSSLRILGSSKNEFKDGILRTTIKLWEGSNILTLVEEKLEGDAKAIIMEPKGREWMLSRLRSYEQASGDKLFRELPDDELKNEDIVEAWSHLGQSYLVGRSTFGEPLQKKAMRRFGRLLMRSGLTGAMNAESSFFAAVASRAQKLGELKQAGKLGDDLVSELEKQLGIDSQVSHNAVAEEMGTEIVQKGIDTSGYSPETPGPNGETFSMSRAVPADASKIVQMPDGAQLVGPTTFSIRAFHATPHKVDKFTTAKIGTGEGAQAYGWGLYFAESEAVSGRGGVYDRQFEAKTGKPSNIYTVELLPDESEFLDWDKPLSEQSEKVKAAIEPLISQFITNNENFINSELKAQAANGTMPGSKAYLLLGGEMSLAGDRSYPPALASRNLSDAGIPGVRYADQQSRVSPLEIRARQQEVNARKVDVERDPSDTNKAQLVSAENALADLLKKDREGTRNYVIFDENLVSILEENGKPVEGETFSLGKVTPAQDAEYLAAVEAGDMAKAQAMVDKAAIYDNTPRKNIDRGISNGVIEPELRSLFDSYIKAARKVARRYTESGKAQRTSTPQQTGAVNRAYRLLSEKYSELHPGDYLREGLADQERAFNSISDPVTYDNAGNVIPLSKRFNPADNRITYSIRPGDFSARMEAKFSLFQAKPELRLAIAQVAKERALRLGAEWIAKGDVIRSAKNISKEQAFREADGFDRRMNAYLDSLSENARQTLEFEPSALEDDPLVSAMLDFGKLMSFTTAKKSGKVEANSGDYDGQPWLPPAWYSKGAGIMPDQMAQAMFDAGLLPDAYTGTLWSEIGKRIESTRKDKAAHREAVQAYKDAQKAAKADAKAEAEAWANQARKTAGSPKAQRDMLKGALRTLDGILAAAPPEVRARVGGYVKLAGLATDEAMLQEIERRIDKLNVELEKYLKKEAVAEIKKLFKKARPDMEAGKKGKGKDPDMHALFAVAESAAEMDALAVAGRLADLDARIASGELTPEQEVLAITERGVVELVGDLKAADSGRAFSALDTLRDIYQGAWLKWKLAEIERKERRAGMRQDFIDDTGKTGVRTERTKADKVNESLFGKGKAWLLNLSSMHEVLAYAFGLDNSRVASLVDAERAASNTYEDTNQRLGDEIEELFTSLAGTRTKGERLRWNLSQRTIKTGKGELSQLEAIQALLMWRQEDGRRHMEGTRNENNEVTSKWSYDQAWIDEIEAALTSEARQVMSFIMGKYSAEWATLNPLYRARYGVNMPHHDAYAPITVTPVQTKAGDVVDPVTGSAVSGGSILTPGSLRTRSRNAIAEPDFRDALQTMILHSRQMEYWKAYYDLAVEMNAVLGNREVMNSVYAKGGKEAANALRQWIDAIGQGGFRDASLRLALFQAGSKMQGRAAGVALLGRMSAILSQSTQLAAAAVKIPVTSYLVRLAKLMTGGLGWRDAMRSEFIQRRFKSAPPIVRQAMDSLAAAKPNEIQGLSRFFGNVLSGADAFFTSGTYAILLDYHREQGAAAGLTGAELETYAHTEAERATEQVAQPTRMANRSLAELANTGPLGKIGWAFASEARQKVALAAHAALNAKNDPVTAAKAAFLTFAVGGLFTQVLKNLLREAKGDDDREMWSLGRLGYAMTVAPIASAIPFGSAIAGDSNMLSNVQRAAQTLGNEEVDFRDVDAILSAAGLFNDNAASLAPLSHLGLDLGKILTNAAD
jgi:hypothetical protein